MKKVGIITSYLDFDKNYGGVLQAYALSKRISFLGYYAYIMPYVYEHIPINNKKSSIVWKFLRFSRDCIIPEKRKRLKQRKMNRVMMNYVNTHMPIYKTERMTLNDIKDIADDFYAFVCGSDQVWSTKLQRDRCDPGMFLQFVPQDVKKIAYAPSLGSTTSVSQKTANEIRACLSDFDAISVREHTGQSLLKSITGKEYPIVLDPTLLLKRSEWDEIACVPQNLEGKYILVYRFGDIPFNHEKIKEIQAKLDLPIIELPSSLVALKSEYTKRYDIDPGMFLGLISNATLVCTDSFHATVFSIIYKTPFISFYRQDSTLEFNMNSRIDNLLIMTGLSERILNIGDDIKYSKLFNIDFDLANKKIDALRENSFKYLSDALLEESK